MSMNVIAREIRAFRKSNPEWTQEVFAELVRVSRVTISKWENGKQIPDFTQRKRLSSIGLDLSDTFTFIDFIKSTLYGNVALLSCVSADSEGSAPKWEIFIGDLGLPPNVLEHVLTTIPIPRMARIEVPRAEGGNWIVQILPIEHDNSTSFYVSIVQNIPNSVTGYGREELAFPDISFDAFLSSPSEDSTSLSVVMKGLTATENGKFVNIGITKMLELPKPSPKRKRRGRPSKHFPSPYR